MDNLGILRRKHGFVGPTFSIANRIRRLLWFSTWLIMARWTPPGMHKWRVLLLNLFGARVSSKAYVYGSVRIWAPWNLEMLPFGTLGPEVRCYNIARVTIGFKAVVSQGAHLCTGSHDYRDSAFPLIAQPISILDRAWVCADAFVGPGVVIGRGAVLAAASVTFEDLNPWTIYLGNPAEAHKYRDVIDDEAEI